MNNRPQFQATHTGGIVQGLLIVLPIYAAIAAIIWGVINS